MGVLVDVVFRNETRGRAACVIDHLPRGET